MAENELMTDMVDPMLTEEDGQMLEDVESPEEETYEMDDSDIIAYIDDELANSLGGDINDSELTKNWEEALSYYLGRPRGDELPGRSKLISMDVANVVEQTLAQLMPAFSSSDLGEFEPIDDDDEDQALDESGAMNYIMLDENRGYITFLQSIKDGMLQRGGFVKCMVDEEATVSVERHTEITDMQLQELVQPKDRDEEVEVLDFEILQEAGPSIDPNTGAPVMVEQTLLSAQIKRITKARKARAVPVPPEEIRIRGDHNSPFLHDCKFICHESPKTRGELIALGYDRDIVMGLETYTQDTDEQNRARSRDEAETQHGTVTGSNNKLGETVLVRESYCLLDVDGDGYEERRKIVSSGTEILDNDYFPTQPIVGGMPFIMPHRFFGLSYYDKLKQVQDAKTGFIRKTTDNAEGLINQRVTAVAGQVHMGDLLASRPTGVIRVKSQGALEPFPVQNMGDTGFRMLSYFDKERREAGGSALDLGTQENNPVPGAGAHGLERYMSTQEQLTALIAKTFAETLIQGAYVAMHILIREFMPEELRFRSSGKNKKTNVAEWKPRNRVAINIGLSVTERERRAAALEDTIQKQIASIKETGPGVLADMSGIHRAVIDQAKARGINNPEQYWIDPSSKESLEAQKRLQESGARAREEQQKQVEQVTQLQLQLQAMQEETKRMKQQMDMAEKTARYVQDWVKMELENQRDVPGQGIEGNTVVGA